MTMVRILTQLNWEDVMRMRILNFYMLTVTDKCMDRLQLPLDCRRLEPNERKLSCPVLRGERGCDALLSYPTTLPWHRRVTLYRLP